MILVHLFSSSAEVNSVRRNMTKKFLAFPLAQPGLHHVPSVFAGSLLVCLALMTAAPVAASDLAGLPHTRDDLSDKDRKRVERVVAPASSFGSAERFESMQGGAGTSTKLVNRDSLSHFNANLTFEEEETFKLGNALFRKLWVSSPSSTQASDGLGPLFNARACQSCHIKDGRGHPPEGAADATSMFLRLARPARTDEERQALEDHLAASLPDPVYGAQFQDLAVPGLLSEGKMVIDYQPSHAVELGDGSDLAPRISLDTTRVHRSGSAARPGDHTVAAHDAHDDGHGNGESKPPSTQRRPDIACAGEPDDRDEAMALGPGRLGPE